MLNRILLPGICILFCLNIDAQSPNKEIDYSNQTPNKATIAQDRQTLENLTEKDLTYGHSTGTIQDKPAYLKDILSGPAKFSPFENTEQTISLLGDLAIVRNICSLKDTKDGAPLNLRLGVLMIWKKRAPAGNYWRARDINSLK